MSDTQTAAGGAKSIDPVAPLLSVRDVRVSFATERGRVYPVNGVSFDVAPGETLGIVGESGSGKSVTSLSLVGLLPRTARTTGSAIFDGRDLLQLRESELRRIRGREIGMIFQDPMSSLNPVLTVGRQVREALDSHFDLDRSTARRRSIELLDMVGIPSAADRLGDYPHQFSGGMRQRVMIAIALACKPRLLIADEPTTALDVTVQAQILALLRELVQQEEASLILITHDLGVVASMCDRVNVMYGGLFVESAPAEPLFATPRHPYTHGLLHSVPRLNAPRGELDSIEGVPPHLSAPPAACPFQPRCKYDVEQSAHELPALTELAPGHFAACFNPMPVGGE